MITLFLLIALICFVIATFNLASPVNMTALGLVFITLAMMFPGLSKFVL